MFKYNIYIDILQLQFQISVLFFCYSEISPYQSFQNIERRVKWEVKMLRGESRWQKGSQNDRGAAPGAGNALRCRRDQTLIHFTIHFDTS